MGVQKNIKKLQDQVEILGGALTRTLKDLENKNVEQQLEKGD